MKPGWEIRTLGEVCEFQNGFAFKSSTFTDTGEPIIRISDIQNDEVIDTNVVYFNPSSYHEDLSRFIVYPGDILIAMSGGTTGKLGMNNTQRCFYLNQRVGVFRENKALLNHEFLFHFLHTKSEESLRISAGAAQPNLSTAQIKAFEIPVPSLTEQQRIVGILDQEFAKIDALKANAEKSLQAAKDLFQATLKKELEPKEGWKRCCLQDVCTDYGDYGMSLPSKSFDGVRYLRITDITEWGDLNDDKVSVDADEIDERYMVRAGDILFARTGATVGKTLVYEERFGRCCYAGYLIRYRPDQNIVLPRMLYYITHSASYYEWVAISQKSATLPNISAKLYNSYELSLPSTKEQGRIISQLDELNEKCFVLQQNYQKTLSLCDDLKQALLRKAFNGEL